MASHLGRDTKQVSQVYSRHSINAGLESTVGSSEETHQWGMWSLPPWGLPITVSPACSFLPPSPRRPSAMSGAVGLYYRSPGAACVCSCVCTYTHTSYRHTHTESHTQSHTHRHTHSHTHSHITHTDTESHRDLVTHRDSHTHSHTDTQTYTVTHTHTVTQRHSHATYRVTHT